MKRSELDIVLKELTEQIYDLLGDKLDKVVLYGSYARGDNTEESDVMVKRELLALNLKKLVMSY